MSVYINNKRVGATIAVSIGEETDPTVPQYVKDIKEQDIANWNAKIDQEQLEGYSYDKSTIDSKLAETNSSISDLSTKYDTIEPTVSANTKSIENNTTEIGTLKTGLQTANDNIGELQTSKSDKSDTGNKIKVSINSSNYIMTVELLNDSDVVLSSGTVDLPLETVVVNATYLDGTLTLVLQNGNSVDVDISDLVDGLVSQSSFDSAIQDLSSRISAIKVPTTLAELADDETHRLVTDEERADWSSKASSADLTELASRVTAIEKKDTTQDTAIATAQSTAESAASAAASAQNTANSKYTKPSGGIPADDLAGSIPSDKITGLGLLATKSTVAKTDLSSDIQTSLGKADSALQSHQSLTNYYTKSETNSEINSAINTAIITALNTPV